MRNQPNDLILGRIANHSDRIASLFHRLNGFFVQAAQKNYTTIGVGEMLGGSVVNRPLAFLREPILIAPCEPTDGIVPLVNPELALDETCRRFILHGWRSRS